MGDVVVISGQDFLSDGGSVNVVEKDGQKVEQTEKSPKEPSADISSSPEASSRRKQKALNKERCEYR